jgi:hypothetical protein
MAALICACGPDTVTVDPPLRCEPGPVFSAVVESCELTIDGDGGPVAVRMWTIAADDGSAWSDFALAPDGAIYVLGEDRSAAIVVARLGPDLQFEWSRRLVHDLSNLEPQAWPQLGPHALGFDGVDLISQVGSTAHLLTHVDASGSCGAPTSLEFGGKSHARARTLLREDGRLVLAATASEPSDWSQAFVQHRSLAGELVTEVEIGEWQLDVSDVELFTGGPARYHASYGGYAPVGYWSSYLAVALLDESLSVTGGAGLGFTHQGYHNDARGRLYIASRDQWDSDSELPDSPPITIEVRRLANEDQAMGETIALEVPQPECGFTRLSVRDESLLVLSCSAPERVALLGYQGSGPPSWTLSLSCPDDLRVTRFEFDQDGRLWVGLRSHDRGLLLAAEL